MMYMTLKGQFFIIIQYNIPMKSFQHPLWGYEIQIPNTWFHMRFKDKDGFAANPKAFEPDYEGERLGQLLIHGEWNALQKPAEVLWKQHISKTAMLLGAKDIASAPWSIKGYSGYEVEIVLPKKSEKRLWAGVLERGWLVLTFMVLHWKVNRESFEPLVSEVIKSLRFIEQAKGVSTTQKGIPLPPGVTPADPSTIINDILEPEAWQAYQSHHPLGQLQAFYTRELPQYEWDIEEYIPFPNQGEHPFARYKINKGDRSSLIGLFSGTEKDEHNMIVLKKTT